MIVATPFATGVTSRISTTSESPGSAPRTATGPVAPLTRSKSIAVTRSASLWIWPVKQSFVSKVTTEPGSTSRTGSISGPKPQTIWSRVTLWSMTTVATAQPAGTGRVPISGGSRSTVSSSTKIRSALTSACRRFIDIQIVTPMPTATQTIATQLAMRVG